MTGHEGCIVQHSEICSCWVLTHAAGQNDGRLSWRHNLKVIVRLCTDKSGGPIRYWVPQGLPAAPPRMLSNNTAELGTGLCVMEVRNIRCTRVRCPRRDICAQILGLGRISSLGLICGIPQRTFGIFPWLLKFCGFPRFPTQPRTIRLNARDRYPTAASSSPGRT